MDTATKLRRRFRKRAQDPTAHTIQKGGLWYYNRRVPAEVLAIDPELPEVIRRATGTDRLKEAQAIVREWAAADEERWLAKLEGREPSPWLVGLNDPAERERVLDKAEAALEARAEKLRVADALDRSKSLATVPEVLRRDPQARRALEVAYAAQNKPMTWVQAWEEYEGVSGVSVETKKAYASTMRQLDRDGVKGPHDITRPEVREWLRKEAQRISPSSGRIHIAAGTSLLRHMFPDDEARQRLFKGHTLKYLKKPLRKEGFSREELRDLIEKGNLTRIAGLFMRLSLGTGARKKEIFAGTWDLDSRTLKLNREDTKSDAGVRVVPFSDRLIPAVEAWLELKRTGSMPKEDAVSRAFVRARKLAGLPVSKTLHSCRHTFLTELALNGVPTDRREAIGGHSAGKAVHARYIHWTVEVLRRDVEAVDFETGIEWP